MLAYVMLEDGSILTGKSFGYEGTSCGEIVFNTGMTGYQEILTDPSYAGQIVVMTYPLIGNYGINEDDFQSSEVQVSGFIVKEASEVYSHYHAKESIQDYLKKNKIIAISNVDTRMLTKKIRNSGTMNCLITTETIDGEKKEKLKKYVFPSDIVTKVSRKEGVHISGRKLKVGIIDLGVKQGIIDNLKDLQCDIRIFPHDVSKREIDEYRPAGILFSNGPGNPEDISKVIALAKKLIGEYPLFGICLGHQVLALALGGETYKMKYGHRGSNHPVINLETNKVFISAQNHGYCVKNNLPDSVRITHLNVNDHTVEGFSCKKLAISALQFHPEEGPGPTDYIDIFKDWIKEVEGRKENA